MSMLHSWLRAVRALMLGLWAGGILMTFIAAPVVFDKLKDDRTKAGNIVGEILHVGGKVKMVWALPHWCWKPLFFTAEQPVLCAAGADMRPLQF